MKFYLYDGLPFLRQMTVEMTGFVCLEIGQSIYLLLHVPTSSYYLCKTRTILHLVLGWHIYKTVYTISYMYLLFKVVVNFLNFVLLAKVNLVSLKILESVWFTHWQANMLLECQEITNKFDEQCTYIPGILDYFDKNSY